MTDLADIVIRVDSSQLNSAAGATEELRRSTLNLLGSVDRVAAAQISHANAMRTLRSSVTAGIITQRDMARATASLTQRLEAQGLTLNNLGEVVERNTGSLRRFGSSGMQQVGYQVGDFAVQVQGGTNALVALGQQGTQLLGIFGPTGAILGAFFAIGTAILNVYFQTEKFKQAANNLKTGISELRSEIKLLQSGAMGVAEEFGKVTTGLERTVRLVATVTLAKALGDARTQLAALTKDIYTSTAPIMTSTLLDQRYQETQRYKRDLGMGGAQATQMADMELALARATTDKERLDILNQMNAEIEKQVVSGATISDQGLQYLQSMALAQQGLQTVVNLQGELAEASKSQVETEKQKRDAIGIAKDLTNAQDEAQRMLNGGLSVAGGLHNASVRSMQEQLRLAKDHEEMLINAYEYMGATMRLSAEQVASYEKENEAIDNRLLMEIAIAKFGKDSAEVKKLQREKELDLYDQGIDKLVILGQYTKEQGELLKDSNRIRQDAVDLQQKETDSLNRGKELAREFLATYLDIGKAVEDISKVDLKSVFEDALPPSSALYQFVSKTWTTMLNMSKFQPRDYSGFTYGGAFAESRMEGPSEPPKIKDKTGIGGGGAKTDPLAELQKQIALQEELNGKTEAEKRVRQALGDDYAKYSPTIIKGLEDQIQKQIELEDRLKEQQGLYDTIQSSMEDAFMSMVDGTKSAKDAFKSMAAAIIKELYNVLVVQQLVGSFDRATGKGAGITGFLGKALTGMFKADGGPVSAGQPYIVGERGPELIIPKSSGMVLTNGQTKAALGGVSNDNYVVHNNINVTGSDSVMVRQEIAKMIPQISSATKAAMIDAKRRGGQMGNAFR